MAEGQKDVVVQMLRAGYSYDQICAKTGLTKASISYHAKKHGLSRRRLGLTYDWEAIQAYYDAGDEGHTMEECRQRFGFSRSAWYEAVKAGRVRPRLGQEFETRLVKGQKISRVYAKRRLIERGLLTNTCAECGINAWRGRPLSLQLHHVNGDGQDWRIENLQLLCPNCHSQTDTYGAKNKQRG